jgi:hypothetical protein
METLALEIGNRLFRRFCRFIAFETVQNNVQLRINVREDCECTGEGNGLYLSSTHLWLRCSNFFNPSKKNSFGCAANRKSQRLINVRMYTGNFKITANNKMHVCHCLFRIWTSNHSAIDCYTCRWSTWDWWKLSLWLTGELDNGIMTSCCHRKEKRGKYISQFGFKGQPCQKRFLQLPASLTAYYIF